MAFKEVLICFVAVLIVSGTQAESFTNSYKGIFSAKTISDGDTQSVVITYKVYKNGKLDASKTRHKTYKLKTGSLDEVQKYLDEYKNLIQQQDKSISKISNAQKIPGDAFSTKIQYRTVLENGKRKVILTSTTTKNGHPFSTDKKTFILKTNKPSEIADILSKYQTTVQAKLNKNKNKSPKHKKNKRPKNKKKKNKRPKNKKKKNKRPKNKKHKNKKNKKNALSITSSKSSFKMSNKGKWIKIEATCQLFHNGRLVKQFKKNYKTKKPRKVAKYQRKFSKKICK